MNKVKKYTITVVIENKIPSAVFWAILAERFKDLGNIVEFEAKQED